MMEASEVTGPAKNLIAFWRAALKRPLEAPPQVDLRLVAFQRGRCGAPTAFVTAAREAGLTTSLICERFRFDWRVIPQLRALVAAAEPDIVQTHNVKSHLLVWLTGLWRTIPWIAFHHGYTATDVKDRLYNQCNRISLRAACRVVTVCQSFSARLQREGVSKARVRILHNTVKPPIPASPAEVASLRARLGLPPGARILLTIGRLSCEKGHCDLVRAIRVLHALRQEPEFRLVIVGDGPERAKIRTLASALGLEGTVVLTGHQANVQPFYALADLFVLPSRSEGSPNVLLEAMAAGVPIVATKVGGVPEIVCHGESALLVEAGDSRAMAEAILRLLQDSRLAHRLAQSAAQAVSRNHTPESYRHALFALYHEVLGAPVSPAPPRL